MTTLIIDSREKTPLPFSVPTLRAGLMTADYSIQGLEHLFGVERKSLDDLASSCTAGRDRFERELVRLRGYRFKRLLIIGDRQDIEDGNYRSRANPKAILATLAAFEVRYDLPVVWAPTPEHGGQLIEEWAHWFIREYLKTAEIIMEATQ